MGNLVINTNTENKTWVFTENGWKLVGSSQHPKVDNAFSLGNFTCQIYKVVNDEDRFIGDANGYMSNDGFKTTINNVPTFDLADVAQVVGDLVEELS